MNEYFVKYKRNPDIIELFKKRPSAVGLLLLIANRAKNTEGGDPSIKLGEAFIGDYETYGATEQIYRTDKSYLKKWQISTFRSTNKGTVAKLTNRAYFDTEWFLSTDKSTDKSTGEQRTTNGQPTTNIEIRDKKTHYRELEFLKSLPLDEATEMAKQFGVTISAVRKAAESLHDYCLAHGKKYKDYRAMLRNSLRRDVKETSTNPVGANAQKYQALKERIQNEN